MQNSYHAITQILSQDAYLKLLYKHHATGVLLLIQKSKLYNDRKVASDGVITSLVSVFIQTTRCSKSFTG